MLTGAVTGKIKPLEYIRDRYQDTCTQSDILPGTSPQERRMKEMVNLNFRWFMQTLLDRKDRMSMYSGLEVRVPFCDYRIAEYLYGVPWEFKDYQGKEKGLLRTAMADLLPQECVQPTFDRPDAAPSQLMEVLDKLQKSGCDVHFANRASTLPWKREFTSPCYTTKWDDLPEVR
jgi:asparagine synthetase B (glutamine-hydrolysing)